MPRRADSIILITILLSGSKPGLQVKNKDNSWMDVKSDYGYLIVNIGDMLQECSKGYYPSTTHRVVNPNKNEVYVINLSNNFPASSTDIPKVETSSICIITSPVSIPALSAGVPFNGDITVKTSF